METLVSLFVLIVAFIFGATSGAEAFFTVFIIGAVLQTFHKIAERRHKEKLEVLYNILEESKETNIRMK